MPSRGVGLITAIGLILAALSAVMAAPLSASAAEPATVQAAEADKPLGHQPPKTRATTVADRSDAPQHRVAPWTPLAVVPAEPTAAQQIPPTESTTAPSAPRLSYDAPTPQGRAPPR